MAGLQSVVYAFLRAHGAAERAEGKLCMRCCLTVFVWTCSFCVTNKSAFVYPQGALRDVFILVKQVLRTLKMAYFV